MLLALLLLSLAPLRPLLAADEGLQIPSAAIADDAPKLDPRISRADPKHYRAVLDARDWTNPWVDVTNNGFWLRTRSAPERRFVGHAELRAVLTELPVRDWPYGRVVVIQQPEIVADDPEWLSALHANFVAAREVAAVLDADWWAWPP